MISKLKLYEHYFQTVYSNALVTGCNAEVKQLCFEYPITSSISSFL